MRYAETKALYLELQKEGRNSLIFQLNFVKELLDYVSNSDLAIYNEYMQMNDEQILNSDSFKNLASDVYDEFLSSDEYNLSSFMDEYNSESEEEEGDSENE